MSVTFPRYAQIGYPSQNQIYQTPFQVAATRLDSAGLSCYALANPSFTPVNSLSQPHVHSGNGMPSLPRTPRQFKALAKAIGFILPAVALAKFAPGQAKQQMKELFPSDWKVWAKLILGILTMGQLNKALNWTPPPWLGALMNVAMMAGLMTGFTKSSLKVIAILGPCMAGLVQGTHFASDKLEKPLQEKYHIPPVVTRLTLSIASMGAGFFALPKVFEWVELGVAKLSSKQAEVSTSAFVPAGCACCGTPICLNETANYSATAIDSMRKHFTDQKKDAQ